MEYNVGDKVDTEVGIGVLAAMANGCAKISSSRICIEYRDFSTSNSTFYEVYGGAVVPFTIITFPPSRKYKLGRNYYYTVIILKNGSSSLKFKI